MIFFVIYLEELHVYQNLINMGFDESISMNAIKKCGKNINKCINWIMSNKNEINKKQTNHNHNVNIYLHCFSIIFFLFLF